MPATNAVDDAIDSIMEGSDDEAEGAEILNGVLEEIGLEVNAKVRAGFGGDGSACPRLTCDSCWGDAQSRRWRAPRRAARPPAPRPPQWSWKTKMTTSWCSAWPGSKAEEAYKNVVDDVTVHAGLYSWITRISRKL